MKHGMKDQGQFIMTSRGSTCQQAALFGCFRWSIASVIAHPPCHLQTPSTFGLCQTSPA